jgi:hypothetical protein
MSKFKPCPFCGCRVPPAVQGNGIGDNWLECTECGASTRLREDGAGSEKDWNRRAARATAEQSNLTVWSGSMPESNGKSNFTAILHRGDLSKGHTIDRSEYPDRVRYEADRVRWLIGEIDKEPWILDYDADKHSAYSRLKSQQDAAIESKPAEQSLWQPIETAPKTGRTLLLGYPNSLGNWRTVRGEWLSQDYIEQNWEEPDEAEAGWYETSVEADDVPSCWPITPTHWQPLPKPPADAAKSQRSGDGS